MSGCTKEKDCNKMAKNIVIYFEQYSWGGTDTHLENLLYGWPNRSDHFTILCNFENSGIDRIGPRLRELGNVEVKKFPSVSREGFLLKFSHLKIRRLVSLLTFPLFWLFWALQFTQSFQLLKEEDPVDILLSNNGGYPGGWGCNFIMLASYLAKVPKRILLIHHQATEYRRGLTALEKKLDELFFLASTDIVAVSEATKKTILDIRNFPASKKIEVIYNGINVEPSNVVAEDLREKFGVQDKLLVGIMGVIERYKGHEDLIKILNKMEDSDIENFCFLIIGKGAPEEVAYLNSLMEKNSVRNSVIFTGYIDGDSQSIIKQLDLMLVLTKDFEGFGLTLAEAMSVNVPVLATQVGAIPEFIQHEINGYLIPPCQPMELEKGLKDFKLRGAEWIKRAEVAKMTIKQYSRERLGSEFHQLSH